MHFEGKSLKLSMMIKTSIEFYTFIPVFMTLDHFRGHRIRNVFKINTCPVFTASQSAEHYFALLEFHPSVNDFFRFSLGLHSVTLALLRCCQLL